MGAYRFEAPLLLLLLLLLLPLAWWLRRPRRGAALRLSTLSYLQSVRPNWRVRLRPALLLLRLLAIALIVVALARPQKGQANAVIQNHGIDIMIAQDLSGSMNEQFGPQTGPGPHDTRLSAAKRLSAQFVSERKNDRVGLVVFESQTRVITPPTSDHRALTQLIGTLQNGLYGIPDGTAIGEGLTSAINQLRDSQARSRVIILLTDGEENVHMVEPEEAAKLAKTLGIRVYTIGIIDPATNEVDVTTLKNIAEPTGGAFFPATSPQALADVYDKINSLEQSRIEQLHYYRYDELAPFLLIPALGLILVEALLANTIFRRTP
jgi:Ca-activated chloride channel family protein